MNRSHVSPPSFVTRMLFATALALAPFAALANNVVPVDTNTTVIKNTDAPPATLADNTSSLVLNSAMLAKAENTDGAVLTTAPVCTINVARATTTGAANLKGGDAIGAQQTVTTANFARLSQVNVTDTNDPNNLSAGFAAITTTDAMATSANNYGASTTNTTSAANLKGAAPELVGVV